MKKSFVILASLMLLGQIAQAARSVTLNWIASSDAAANPSLAYNVYRAPSACTGTPAFVKLTSTPVAAVTFADTSAVVGNTYCYQVTATLNGLESGPSNTFEVRLPPTPPSGLTGTVQ